MSSSGSVRAGQLDITMVTPRIIAMGFPWRHRTEKKAHRNNVREVSTFLHSRYPEHFMVWNLSGKHDIDYFRFGYQYLECDSRLAYGTMFTLEELFRICYSIHCWLELDPKNVAVLHCTNGKNRTGVVVACYLVYSGAQGDPHEALAEFYRKRLRRPAFDVTEIPSLTNSTRQVVSHFHNVAKLGRVPFQSMLCLKCIIVTCLPWREDRVPRGTRPVVEIFTGSRLLFSSATDPDASVIESTF